MKIIKHIWCHALGKGVLVSFLGLTQLQPQPKSALSYALNLFGQGSKIAAQTMDVAVKPSPKPSPNRHHKGKK